MGLEPTTFRLGGGRSTIEPNGQGLKENVWSSYEISRASSSPLFYNSIYTLKISAEILPPGLLS